MSDDAANLRILEALLFANAQAADETVRVEAKPIPPADLRKPAAGALAVQEPPAPLPADHEVVEHAVPGHQVEMLVHHADPVGQGIGRAAHRD